MEYTATNYAQLAPQVYKDLNRLGVPAQSRNGNVLRLPGVTTFTVHKPWQRVNFSPERDANPFFHLVEAMAMLAGHNSAPLMTFLAKNMANFSDDGHRYNAFYGTRIRNHFGFDQLVNVINELSINPESRQCVVQIWDPEDLRRPTKDKACNLCLIFDLVDGHLNMTSFNRSNDAIWGIVTGANVVHLSYFHEYVACALGAPMGRWSHTSANLHVYTDNSLWEKLRTGPDQCDHYPVLTTGGRVPLFNPGERLAFDHALKGLMGLMEGMRQDYPGVFREVAEFYRSDAPGFLKHTVLPAFEAWCARKLGNQVACDSFIESIEAPDWKTACRAWANRRLLK